jgi:hypothetical protein
MAISGSFTAILLQTVAYETGRSVFGTPGIK